MPTEGKWDQYLESVRRYIATDRLDSDEIDYKREIGKKLKDARSALLAGKDEWFDLLKQALSGRKGHPMNWRGADNLRNWLDSDRKAGREALRTVWSDGDLKPGDIRAFSERLPYEGAAKGLRSRLRTISVLLMALGLDRYPPYMAKAYDSSFRRLSYDGPPAGADEEDIYWHALAFLDELASRAKKRGLEKPANRLEAQSIVWVMQRWPALLHGPEQIADLPVPVAESPGAVRIGHPERSHLVEYLAPNSVFNSLPRQRSSPHLRPDDRLVTIDRVLHHASLGVA